MNDKTAQAITVIAGGATAWIAGSQGMRMDQSWAVLFGFVTALALGGLTSLMRGEKPPRG